MHGLDTYDYGARQYDPARITWDRMDKFCEKYYNINPYVYCAGNPINLVDPTGMAPDSLEAAMMSALAYGPNAKYTKTLSDKGWNACQSSSSQTGFKSKMFRRETGKDEKGTPKYEYCLAFAGTDTERGTKEFAKDGITDVLNAAGIPSPQYAEAVKNGCNASSGIAKNSELTFTGHSLGGGLATLASKILGKDAIIFNSASISGVVKKMTACFNGGEITHYRAYGDFVNAAQDIMGIPSSGHTKWVNTGFRLSHRIDHIIAAFQKIKDDESL